MTLGRLLKRSRWSVVLGLSAALPASILLGAPPAQAAACTQTVLTGTQAVGGTNYTSRVIQFTGAGCTSTWTIPARATVEALAVGGGGGGGGDSTGTRAGGGGGGGVATTLASTSFTNPTAVTVTVGAGGAGGSGSSAGSSGGNSSITGTGVASVVGNGGSGGTSGLPGSGGASGSNLGGTGSSLQTFAGGGGGAGGAGNPNGAGGVGYRWPVRNSGFTNGNGFGGGGSGGGYTGTNPRASAVDGGGKGTSYQYCLGPIAADSGGGGGGGAANESGCSPSPGAGAAGTVLLSYVTTVTLDPNGGTGSPVDQIAAASTALTTNTFTKQYYTFAGWNTAADGTGTSYTDGGTYDFTAGGTTLYAQWTGASQTITYNANGGSGSESDTTGPTDASVTLSSGSGLSRTGYTLIGWSTSSSATTADYALGSSITMPGGGLSLYAVWSGDVQTITYNANGGSGSVSDTTGTTGSSVTLPSGTGLSRLGYSLLGWDTSASATTPTYSPGASVTMPAGGLALYAIWGVASQTITYNANGGSGSVADTTGNTGTTVTLASGASLSGGTSSFLGWSATASDTTPTYSAGASVTMPAGGLALYAIWDPPIVVPTPEPTPPPPPLWTLGFDANGGTCTSSSGQAFDTAWLTLPGADACTRAGYEFAGWNTAADGSGTGFPPGGSTQMSGDNTLYAQWTKVVTPILPPAPAPTPDPSGSAAPAPDPSPAPTSSSPSPSTPSPGGTPGSNGAGPIPAPNPMPTGGGVNLRPSQGSIVQPNGGIVDPLAGASAGPGGSLAGASVSIWDGTRWTQQFTDPGVGTWLVEAGKVRFLPVPGFTGTASTTMRVVDTNGNAGYAPISFTVAPEPATSPSPEPSGTRGRGSDGLGPVPPPPPLSPTESGVVVYPQGSALSGSGGAVNVLDGAIPSTGAQVDPDSVVLWDGASWVSSFDDPGVGSWRVVGGRVEFTPAVGFCGTASTTAKVSDTSGRAGTAPVAFARSCTSPGSDGTGVVPAPPPYPFDGSSGPQPQRRVVTGTADSDGGVVDLAAALGDAAADLNTARLWDGQAWVTSFTDPGVGTWRIVNGRVIFTPAKRFRGTARTTFWVAGSDGTPIQGPISFTVDQPCFDPSSRQLVIGFDPTKASLSRSDRAKIRAFMEQGCSYSIVGYVQAAGPTSNDLSLSRARADVVARYAKKGDYGKPIKVTGGGRWAQDACGEFENRCVVIRSVRTNPASAIPTRSGVSKATLGPALAVGDGLSVLHGMGEASGPMPASPGGGHACHQGGDIWGAAEPLRCS